MPGPLCCGRGGIRLGADLQAERAAGLQQRETRQQRATGSAAALAELTATLHGNADEAHAVCSDLREPVTLCCQLYLAPKCGTEASRTEMTFQRCWSQSEAETV